MSLTRLFHPESVAVVGGGAWGRSVLARLHDIGFGGPVWHVHPRAEGAFASLADLPGAPDAVFLGVNREATIDAVAQLSAMNAGGAVCFASGFAEAAAENAEAEDMQAALLKAAGDMPVLGPNCYGFINALDGVCLWPDQHGAQPCDSGVALITQSSNMAINLTMQRRGLPVAYVVTAGNQAQQDLAGIGTALLDDPRVTALGLHIEGIKDLRAFEAMAAHAQSLGKRIVAVKVGASEEAQRATISHTASLAGSDAGARALLKRLGIAQVSSLSCLLETLKLLHVTGGLAGNRIASMSCSGGEASLIADTALPFPLVFPPLNTPQSEALRTALGPRVALANPLDYHTYIWGDADAMTACYSAMMIGDLDLGCVVVDLPRDDISNPADWDCALEALEGTVANSSVPMALLASLPDTLPEDVAARLIAAGVVPLCGFADALEAMSAAGPMPGSETPVLLPKQSLNSQLVPESIAKKRLSDHGMDIPKQGRGDGDLTFPVVVKATGLAHKTEAGGVALNLSSPKDVATAVDSMPGDAVLVEEMITDGVAELLVGVVCDPAHGYVLTLGAGGVLTELLSDTTSLLLPTDDASLVAALGQLRIAPLLAGYRGKPSASMAAILTAINAVQATVLAADGAISEIEINPLICTPHRAVAADALIREGEPQDG